MKKHRQIFAIFVLFSSFFCIPAVAEAIPVDFYAAISDSKDTNMIRMTENLYFQQLNSLDGYDVSDRRPEEWQKKDEDASDSIVFFAEIQESPDSAGWICILNAISRLSGERKTSVKIYDSYYKILLDAKNSLVSLLSSLNSDGAEAVVESEKKTEVPSQKALSVESIAGNWTGEPYIEKIVILRGGKGFVIYKNGASMTIQVSISGNSVHVQQVGRPNASYYPELPRETAMLVARTAAPIEWNLSMTDDDTLSGKKSTLEPADTPEGAASAHVEVVWQRKK